MDAKFNNFIESNGKLLGRDEIQNKISQTDGIFLVYSGRVDLFIASEDSNGRTFSRKHISKFEKGAMFFGLKMKLPEKLKFIITFENATSVSMLDQNILQKESELNDLKKEISVALASWCTEVAEDAYLLKRSKDNILNQIYENRSRSLDLKINKYDVWFQQIKNHAPKRLEREKKQLHNALNGMADQLNWDDEEFESFETEDVLVKTCRFIIREMGNRAEEPIDNSTSVYMEQKVFDIAGRFGVGVRKITLSKDWWDKDNGILLVFLNGNRPAAALPSGTHRYFLHDLEKGHRRKVDSTLASEILPQAYMFYLPFPQKELKFIEVVKTGLKNLYKIDVIRLLYLSFVMSLLSMTIPITTSILFKYVIPESNLHNLLMISAILTAFLFSGTIFHMFIAIVKIRINWKMDWALESAVWNRIFKLPIEVFGKMSVSAISKDASNILGVLSRLPAIFSRSLYILFNFILNLGLMFYFNGGLAAVALAFALLYIVVTVVCSVLRAPKIKDYIVHSKLTNSLLFQLFIGTKRYTLLGAGSRFFSSWLKSERKRTMLYFKAETWNNIIKSLNVPFLVLMTGILFYTFSIQKPTLAFGNLIAFLAATTAFSSSIVGLCNLWVEFSDIRNIYKVSRDIFSFPVEDKNGDIDEKITGDIELHNVAYKYPGYSKNILENININVRRGEVIAITGPAASGKSTLLKIICGSIKPLSGDIYFDMKSMEKYHPISLYKNIGVLTEDFHIYPGSLCSVISAHIPFAFDNSSLEKMKSGVLKKFFSNRQLKSEIFDDAVNLSSSERMMLRLASILTKKPVVVILDECDRTIDVSTFIAIIDKLKALSITCVLTSVSTDVLNACDRVYFIENGKVAEKKSVIQAG